jgi:hypothetical protein
MMLTGRIGLQAQYAVILGPTANDGESRFNADSMTQEPNTVYRAERFTAGVVFYF